MVELKKKLVKYGRIKKKKKGFGDEIVHRQI